MNQYSLTLILILAFAAVCVCPTGAETSKSDSRLSLVNDTIPTNRDSVATELQEVTVIQSNVKRRGKESSYKVTEALRKGCRNTGEVIGKLEGVFYEPITKTISYIGSQNIVLLVDSVKKDASYIKRINPDKIDRITIVSNPIGEYSGYDAVINIHRIPDYVGYEGNVGANTNIYTANRNGKGHPFKNVEGLADFTYTFNNLTLAASAKFNRSDDAFSIVKDTRYPYNNLIEKTIVPENVKENPTSRNVSKNTEFQLSADYQINKNNSVSVLWNISPLSASQTTREDMLYGNPATELETITYENTAKQKNYLYNDFNVYYRGKYNLWQVSSHISYSISGYDSYENVSRSNGYSLTDNRENKFDMLWGGASVQRNSANGKWSFYLSDYLGYSKFEYFRLGTDNRLSRNSELENTTRLSVSYYPTDKFSIGIEPGLKIYVDSDDKLKNTYVRPTFSAWVAYAPTPTIWMRLNYRTNTGTSALRSMSDYGQFTDSLIYSSGNPLLKPYRNHRVSLTVSPLRNLVISGSYTRTLDDIYEFAGLGYGIRPDNIEGYYIDKTFVNGSGGNWDITADYQFQFLKYWYCTLRASVTSKWGKYADYENSKILPKAGAMVMYSNQNIGQFILAYSMNNEMEMTPQRSYYTKSDQFALGYFKNFFNNKLNLQFVYGIPLSFIKQTFKTEYNSKGLQTYSYDPYRNRNHGSIQISLEYRFGNGQSVRRFEHDRNNKKLLTQNQ